jgi:hypothetical protein
MAKIPGSERTIELMVNCKTYPAVSTKYVETVCTGGVQRNGEFVRLYPVPFRFLDSREQYKRWDVISVQAYRDDQDTRPESWHLEPGTSIEFVDRIKSETHRWEWMKRTVYESSSAMEQKGVTNGCVEIEPHELYWKADPKEWTPGQLNVIQQGDLFATKTQMESLADRVPWQFRLKYREKKSGREADAKVLAWSYYQGFRRERKNADSDESALNAILTKVSRSIFSPKRTVFAILGTHSRFKHWMISSLYHVPTDVIQNYARRGGLLF